MKTVVVKLLVSGFTFGLLTSLLFACGKSEIKAKNPNAPAAPAAPAPNPSPAQTNTPTAPAEQPPVITGSPEELVLTSETLQLSKSGAPFLSNKMESKTTKAKSRLTKNFTLKTEKKLSLNFKVGQQGVGYSQCDTQTSPEVTASIKIDGKEKSSKFDDISTLELNANQELSLTVAIDNSLKCSELSFEFSVLGTEVTVSEEPPPGPPIVITPVEGLLTVETKEFLSAGTFGACVDLACFTREQRTSTKKYANPKKKTEEIIEDRFVISPSLELVCFNRHELADTSGIMNSTCKLNLNPTLSTAEVNLYRGKDKKANLVGADITAPVILEKLCGKWPTINSDDKVEVFVDETNKKEIPRLELSCSYDNNQKPKSATFIGVLN